ncbi:MAG: hypothetical protein ACYCYF_07085 [Anaerolineae bacterium]
MRKYGALRFIASLYRILAWALLVAGLAGGLAAIIIAIIGGRVQTPLTGQLGLGTSSLPAAIVLALIVVVSALVCFALLSAVADAVHLALAIEENTRMTVDLLKGEATLNATATAPWDAPG